MKQLDESEMLHRAAAYCSAGERCIQDVERKVRAAGLPEEACRRIVERLVRERFIDERRFARYFVSDKFRLNKWGRVRIDYELQKRNIPAEIRSEALGGIPEQAYGETLLALLRDKMKSVRGRDGREVQAKLIRFAAGRGFGMQEIINCLKRFFDFEEDVFDDGWE